MLYFVSIESFFLALHTRLSYTIQQFTYVNVGKIETEVKKLKKTRILAMLLCLVMLVSLFPNAAFAEETEPNMEPDDPAVEALFDEAEETTPEPVAEVIPEEVQQPIEASGSEEAETALITEDTEDFSQNPDIGYEEPYQQESTVADDAVEAAEPALQPGAVIEPAVDEAEETAEPALQPGAVIEPALDEVEETAEPAGEDEEELEEEGLLLDADAVSESEYLKKCSVTDRNWRCKVLVSSVNMYSLPVMPATNSDSKQLSTVLKQGYKVQCKKSVVNDYQGSHKYWYKVEYDDSSAGACITGYIPMYTDPKDGSTQTLQSCFMEECTDYSCYATLTATKSGASNSCPCSVNSDDICERVSSFSSGKTFTAIAITQNRWGNLWYKVGENEYVYSGDVSYSLKYETPSYTGTKQYPNGNRTVGKSLTIKGTVKTTYLKMTSVGCFVYSGSSTSGTAKTGGWKTGLNTKSFSIQGTDADNKCKIGSLAEGSYTFTIKAKLINYYAEPSAPSTLKSETKEILVFSNPFSEGTVTPKYSVSYDANGGTTTPTEQKDIVKGTTINLSGAISRNSTSAGSFIVSLNANGGSVSQTSLSAARTTNYSFANWNTAADGTGTSYSAGASYTVNANLKLYAQWNSSITTSSVYLPTPTRTGYTFNGWSTSSTASWGTTGYYTPTGDVTLYATWTPIYYYVNYNANGGSSTPAQQSHQYNAAVTLSSAISRNDTSETGYTVTLNANEGSVTPTSLTAARTTSYTFKDWNTAANGSGASYNAGSSQIINNDVTLYAQWTSTTTTAPITLPTPTRNGYRFEGWATDSAATSGVTGEYTPTGDVTLYAVWTQGTFTITYDANGGSSTPETQSHEMDAAVTLSKAISRKEKAETGYSVKLNANGGSVDPTSLTAARTTKYTFKEWNTAQDGSGTSYKAGSSQTINEDITLYAQWTSKTTTAAVTLPEPTRSGYIFSGWGTSASATTGVTGSYTPTKNVTLYAVWTQGAFTITYDANGGSSTPGTQSHEKDVAVTLSKAISRKEKAETGYSVKLNANGGSVDPTSLTAERTTKYTFKEWNTAQDGSGTGYKAGSSQTINEDVTLYAQWTSKTTTAAVTLPTPTRSGYGFSGWGTSASATTGETGSYTPTKNVTLYAIWKETHYTLNKTSILIVCGQNDTLILKDDSGNAVTANWSCSGDAATVDRSGKVSGVRGGFATISVKSEDGSFTGSCSVQVLFTDVTDVGQYFYGPVYWAVERGITSGTSPSTFSPYKACTRAQIMTFLWKACGSPAVSAANPFTDVSSGDYFYNAVLWAVSRGITSGTSATTFSPNKECTRAQCMTFLWKACGSPAVSAANPFTDVSSGDYFYDAVLWAVSRGITSGTGATTFSPGNSCSRGQVMTFLRNSGLG